MTKRDKSLADLIETAVKELASRDDGSTFYYRLDDDLAVYVGWSGGFDPDDGDYFHSENDPEYCICVKVAEWNPADISWEGTYMPWDPVTEEVYDSECAICADFDALREAKWMLSEYATIRKMLDEGKLTFGN